MASPIPCDLHGGETVPADFILSSTANGDTLGVCLVCLPAFVETLVSAIDGADDVSSPDVAGVLPGATAEVAAPSSPPGSDNDPVRVTTDAEWEASARTHPTPGPARGKRSSRSKHAPPPTEATGIGEEGGGGNA